MHVDKRYYNKDRLFSYNAYLNFSISMRGLGKTTCAKMYCADDFLKTGKRFVWVRRYSTELHGDKKTGVEGCVKDFFKKIEKYYPKHKFTTRRNTAYIDGKVAGYFVALSTSQSVKSVDFPNVNKIIFDEFIIKKNKALSYLTDEVQLFLDLISTIERPILDENGKEVTDMKVWLLANAITFANDYFFFFNIKPFKSAYYHDKKRSIVVEQCENNLYVELVKKTRFGQLVKGTKYSDYAIDNQYLLDDDSFIKKKSNKAIFILNIRYEGHEWGVYADNEYVYVTWKTDKSRPFYVFTKQDHTLDSFLIKSARGTSFEILIRNYQMGLVYCENIMIKNKFIDFMKLFIIK